MQVYNNKDEMSSEDVANVIFYMLRLSVLSFNSRVWGSCGRSRRRVAHNSLISYSAE
jgi:hypothetical protein